MRNRTTETIIVASLPHEREHDPGDDAENDRCAVTSHDVRSSDQVEMANW